MFAVMAAVTAQTLAIIRNVSETPTLSANAPANGAPSSPLPRMPMLYIAITRPRRSSRARSCNVLVTVTLKRPQQVPSKNTPASPNNTPNPIANQMWTRLSNPQQAAIINPPGLTDEAISRELVTAPSPSADIAMPYSSLDPPSVRDAKSGTITCKL
jgi:hypothetical protein